MTTSLANGPGHSAARASALALLRTLGGQQAWLQTAAAATSDATTGLGIDPPLLTEQLVEPVLARRLDNDGLEVVVEAETLRESLELMTDQRVEDNLPLGSRLRLAQSYYRIVSIESDQCDGDAYISRLGVEG